MKDPGSILSNYREAHHLFGHQARMWCTESYADKTLTQNAAAAAAAVDAAAAFFRKV